MFSFRRMLDGDDRIFEAPTLAEAERLRHLAATEDGAVVGDIYTEQRFSCGACRYSFRIGVRVPVRPYTECPECGWLEAAAILPLPARHGCGWTTEKPESGPVLFRFVLGHYSLEFEQAALSNSSGAFARTLVHLFATGYALVEGQDRRDQLLAHLRRLPGYTPDAIEVRP